MTRSRSSTLILTKQFHCGKEEYINEHSPKRQAKYVSNISIVSYQVLVCVETYHGSNLEFVARDAAVRNKVGEARYRTEGSDVAEDYYIDRLVGMLDKEFSKAGEEMFGVRETGVYGDVTPLLEAKTLEGIKDVLEVTESVIDSWSKKYKVNDFTL